MAKYTCSESLQKRDENNTNCVVDLAQIIRSSISDSVSALKEEIIRLKKIIVKLEGRFENVCHNNNAVSKVVPDDSDVGVMVDTNKTMVKNVQIRESTANKTSDVSQFNPNVSKVVDDPLVKDLHDNDGF